MSFEHAKGTPCTDGKFHRHCQGRWRGSVSLGYDAKGKRVRRRVTARTKTEAVEAMAKLREQLGQAPKSTRNYTVSRAVEDWLADGLPGRAQSTKTSYRYAVAPLIEQVGHRPLLELTSSEVRLALAAVSGRLSRRTLVITRLCLERAVDFAMSHDRMPKNVVKPVNVPEGTGGRPSKAFDLAQARAVLKSAEDDRLYAYVVISLLSGLRTEEVRALTWDHVDQEAGTVAVWRSVRACGDVKTRKSRRTLKLPELCVEALRRQMDQQQRDRRIRGSKWQEGGLVFATKVGTPLLAGNVRGTFRSICQRAGVGSDWTPRELRHTFVSLMSESGMPVEEIARLVGHRSTVVTETVYRHELRPVIRSGAETMDRLFPNPARETGSGASGSQDRDVPMTGVRRETWGTSESNRTARDDA